MGPMLYLIVVTAALAVLQTPGMAQENSAPPPGVASPPPASPSPAPSAAPSPPSDIDSRRFVLHPIDGGFLRLDMHTGAIDSCALQGTAWNCVPGRDERAAFDREIAQLQRDNAVLKNALLEHDIPLPYGMVPAPPASGGGGEETPIPRPPQTVPPTAAVPAPAHEEETGRVTTALEKGWRRLVEMLTNLQRDLHKQD